MTHAPMRHWLSQRDIGATDLCCVVLIVALLMLAFSPIFGSLGKFPELPKGTDWLKECAFNRSARQAVLRAELGCPGAAAPPGA
jgi:hypothetical protein